MGTGHRFLLLAAAAVVLLAASSLPSCHGHNITKILEGHPEFSTFNHYLSATHLASEINHRLTITVLAVDNSAMAELLSRHFTIFTIKNVLSLHILADYFGAKKLHQITHRSTIVSSLFQATGSADGISGYVNITHFRGGKVGLGAKDTGTLDATFVKSVKEIPYNISIIQISSLLNSPEAEAPAPPPNSYNLTELMTKKGCGAFASLMASNADVQKTVETYVDGGLTIFCPIDSAVSKFMPLWKKLTPEGKTALLLYHAVSDYYSMQMLKQAGANSVLSTLATDGKNFNFTIVDGKAESVSLNTKLASVGVTGTVIDEQPLAIYILNKVLEPRELFKPVAAPGPKGAKGGVDGTDVADGPSGDSVDVKAADDNAAGGRASTAGGVLLSVAVAVAAFLGAGL